MPGSSQIRASEAFVEVTAKDKTAPGLQRAKQSLSTFSQVLAATLSANAIMGIFNRIIGAVRTVFDLARRSVQTFMEISRARGLFGADIPGAAKAKELTNAWIGFQAAIQAVFFTIGAAVSGPLTRMLSIFTEITVHIAMFISSLTAAGGAFRAFTLSLTIVWQSAMVALEQALFTAIKGMTDAIKGAMLGFAEALKFMERRTGADFGSKGMTDSANRLGTGGGMFSFGALGADIARRKELMRQAMDAILGMAGIGGNEPQSGNQPNLPRVLGGSQGTFSGRGASLLGVGPGGGILTKDDDTHKLLMKEIEILQKIFAKAPAAFGL